MLAFQKFQRDLAQHLRDPHHTRRPAGVPARRMTVYNELLFNNVCGFVDSCFPVCRQLLGETRWRRLCRTFYRDWPSHTPWFREIPREFVRYLSEHHIAQPLPVWLADLARYEWAELAVDVMDAQPPAHDPQGNMMQASVLINPARVDVVSPWPVHRIGPDWQPRKSEPTILVVFRDAQLDVQFTEINAVTAHVLSLLDQGLSGQQAFAQLAADMNHPDPQALMGFGQQLLISLREQGVLLGTRT
ncbi:putative DNA-binding domain-containing protein [uncultured Limnohabitans sp.]|jgi:uncharacterized protein|uniref:HvfC family RiPP maturation protein n=1 Tax=uncultured Limnohabitans sp. TaxID=768543 RepID=UPI00261E328C|nr:putative DNA-binding domain-containing protein [uncultured Limnohabitans sp.]